MKCTLYKPPKQNYQISTYENKIGQNNEPVLRNENIASMNKTKINVINHSISYIDMIHRYIEAKIYQHVGESKYLLKYLSTPEFHHIEKCKY